MAPEIEGVVSAPTGGVLELKSHGWNDAQQQTLNAHLLLLHYA